MFWAPPFQNATGRPFEASCEQHSGQATITRKNQTARSGCTQPDDRDDCALTPRARTASTTGEAREETTLSPPPV